MKQNILALAATGLMLASCASMTPSAPQMAPIRQAAATECLASCPALPEHPPAADELASMLWLYDLIDAAGQCRRMHDACRASK